MEQTAGHGKLYRLGVLTVCAFGYSLLFQFLYNLMRYHTAWPYQDFGEVLLSSGIQFLFIYLMCLAVYAVVFNNPLNNKVWIKTSLDLIICGVLFATLNLFVIYVIKMPIDWGGTAFNAIFILLAIETAYYIVRYKETLERNARFREEVAEYRLEVLKAQVNPHFLFNSLNILGSLTASNSPRTPEFIASLASIYRYVLSCEGKNQVSLSEELAFFRNYAEILKMRYPDMLAIDVSIPSHLMQKRIIPFTLQLLLENVTKHNVISQECPMRILITADRDSTNSDCIRMSNPIVKKKNVKGSRVGVRYLTQFYARYDKEFRIENDGKHFTAIIPFISQS